MSDQELVGVLPLTAITREDEDEASSLHHQRTKTNEANEKLQTELNQCRKELRDLRSSSKRECQVLNERYRYIQRSATIVTANLRASEQKLEGAMLENMVLKAKRGNENNEVHTQTSSLPRSIVNVERLPQLILTPPLPEQIVVHSNDTQPQLSSPTAIQHLKQKIARLKKEQQCLKRKLRVFQEQKEGNVKLQERNNEVENYNCKMHEERYIRKLELEKCIATLQANQEDLKQKHDTAIRAMQHSLWVLRMKNQELSAQYEAKLQEGKDTNGRLQSNYRQEKKQWENKLQGMENDEVELKDSMTVERKEYEAIIEQLKETHNNDVIVLQNEKSLLFGSTSREKERFDIEKEALEIQVDDSRDDSLETFSEEQRLTPRDNVSEPTIKLGNQSKESAPLNQCDRARRSQETSPDEIISNAIAPERIVAEERDATDDADVSKPRHKTHMSWDRMFQLLLEFHGEHGHTNVTEKDDRRLYSWCVNQRRSSNADTEKREHEMNCLINIGFDLGGPHCRLSHRNTPAVIVHSSNESDIGNIQSSQRESSINDHSSKSDGNDSDVVNRKAEKPIQFSRQPSRSLSSSQHDNQDAAKQSVVNPLAGDQQLVQASASGQSRKLDVDSKKDAANQSDSSQVSNDQQSTVSDRCNKSGGDHHDRSDAFRRGENTAPVREARESTMKSRAKRGSSTAAATVNGNKRLKVGGSITCIGSALYWGLN